MSETITIRQAVPDDLAPVLALFAQPEMDDGEVLPLSAAREILQRFSRYPDYRLFVAEDSDGGIRGCYALLIMDNLGHLGAPSAIVEGVVVDPRWQGHGIGAAMMRHAMREAAAKRCYKIVLSSNEKRTRAHAFYEDLGFERHGFSFRISPSTDGLAE